MEEKKSIDKTSNYQADINSFRENFSKFKNKKIVLYGIGRYTAVLVPAIKDFHIIGLMDKDEDNIGKVMFGLPVISKEYAEKNADIVIINTTESYWRVIYKRIKDLSIPIFYLNGKNAAEQVEDDSYRDNPYWQQTMKQLQKQILQYEVVSFDIFDTLIMRKVFMPQDVFKLVERQVRFQLGLELDFCQARRNADLMCNDSYKILDDIYNEMNETWKLQKDILDSVKQIEINTELECCVPRRDMVQLYNETALEKEVYLLSDMYLPSEVMSEILRKCGIQNTQNIWISGEKKKNKKSGELWAYFSQKIVKGRKALHIGDNLSSDVRMPRQYGIDSYYVMSSAAMWEKSSLGDFVPKIQKLEQSVFAGMLGTKIFNSPFALSESGGGVVFTEFEQLGYCLWGGVIYSFLVWMVKEAETRGINRFIFFARDGYLLEKDYQYLKKLWRRDEWPEALYIAMSRRLALISSYGGAAYLGDIINVPYNGTFAQYMDDRFNISISDREEHSDSIVSLPGDAEKISEWIQPYREQIISEIEREKNSYLTYISQHNIGDREGVIDLWYNGKNQYYLSQIVGKRLTGFYFTANLAEENGCLQNNILIPCFQSADDVCASQSNIFRMCIFAESFLTAPYGMIKCLDDKFNFVCAPKGENQKYFEERNIMNQGVCEFMQDYSEIMGEEAELMPLFIDCFLEEFVNGKMELGSSLKTVFYYDNSFIHRGESMVFD